MTAGQELVPREDDDAVGDYLDVAALFTSVLPGVGGVVSALLSGVATERKMKRVRELLIGIAEDLQGFQSRVAEEYVRTEDFEDLLEEVMKRTARERSDIKRNIYRDFLVNAIRMPGLPYDEQLRFLRTLEELQPEHVRVIRAMLEEPSESRMSEYAGSLQQTLERRLRDIPPVRLKDLATQLGELKIAELPGGIMTARGAENLRERFTPYGKRFVAYVLGTDAKGLT